MDAAATAPPPARRRARRPFPALHAVRRGAVLVLTVTLAAGLAGCGLRVEDDTPQPRALTADEAARAATVADLERVGADAAAVARGTTQERVRTALRAVEKAARTQVDALGGSYDGPPPTAGGTAAGGTAASGTTTAPAGGSTTPTGPTAGSTGAARSVAGVLALLDATERRARERLPEPDDAGLARLVAQVATAQGLEARSLARAAGSTAPRTVVRLPAAVPTTTPAGASAARLSTVVASEDAAGYALEVLAARSTGETRTALLARAAVHRDRAERWALTTGVEGTDEDPRRSAYALPAKLEGLPAALETTLTADYAALLDDLEPPGRTAVADLLTDSAHAAVTAGAKPSALPGGTPR